MGSIVGVKNVIGAKKLAPNRPKYEEYGVLGAYIQNVKGAYVDTGISCSSEHNISVKAQTYGVAQSSQYDALFGARVSGAEHWIGQTLARYIGSSNQYVYDYFNVGTIEKFIIEWNKNIITKNGEVIHIFNAVEFSNPITYWLFGNNNNQALQYPSEIRIEEFTILSLISVVPLNLTKKPIIDNAGRTHNIGDWVFYDTVTDTVPAHYGSFTGGF